MKINLSTLMLFLLTFVAGAALMHWWDMSEGQKDLVQMQAILKAQQTPQEILTADLQHAELAADVAETDTPPVSAQSASDLPSQRTPIHLEGVSEIYTRTNQGSQTFDPQTLMQKQSANPIELSNIAGKTPADTDNAKQAQMDTNITMIEVPVKARIIATLDDYKDFKRTARGSYPAADFDTEQVLVLESESNLPDKVFEIADVQITDNGVLVLYRVNIFGLDEKINTHSALKMAKTDLPVVLKQVL